MASQHLPHFPAFSFHQAKPLERRKRLQEIELKLNFPGFIIRL